MLFRHHLLAATLILTAPLAQAAHYKLFVLTGESNALGMTGGGETDPSSGSDPADQHIQFFWNNLANASTTIGTSSGIGRRQKKWSMLSERIW